MTSMMSFSVVAHCSQTQVAYSTRPGGGLFERPAAARPAKRLTRSNYHSYPGVQILMYASKEEFVVSDFTAVLDKTGASEMQHVRRCSS